MSISTWKMFYGRRLVPRAKDLSGSRALGIGVALPFLLSDTWSATRDRLEDHYWYGRLADRTVCTIMLAVWPIWPA